MYKEKNQGELAMPFIIEKERDPLYKDGLQKGIEKGIVKGLEKVKTTKISITQKLLKQDMDVETVATITGLLEEEIEKLLPKG